MELLGSFESMLQRPAAAAGFLLIKLIIGSSFCDEALNKRSAAHTVTKKLSS